MAQTDAIDRVDRDPKLTGDEKETTITMYGRDKEFEIYSAKPTIVKSLLKHDNFELAWARIIADDDAEQVTDRSQLDDSDGNIVAVEGRMPIGVLTVKSKPRKNNNQSSIINTETIDSSVFE